MTDTENVFDGFALLGDDEEFDVDKIFGSSSDEPAPPPPAPEPAKEVKPQPEPKQEFPTKTQKVPAEEANQSLELFSAFADAESDPVPLPPADTEKTQLEPEQVQMETAEVQPEPEQTLPAKTQEALAEEKQPPELFSAFTSAESDPIPEAAPVKSIAPRPQTQLSLFDKPPVFQYGGAREQITDSDMTFEALRIQKADCFVSPFSPERVTEIRVKSGKCNGKQLTSLQWSVFPNVERIVVNDAVYKYVNEVNVVGLKKLQSVVIGENSFTRRIHGYGNDPNRRFVLKDCPNLKELKMGRFSFSDYGEIEVSSLDSLEVIEMGTASFYAAILQLKSNFTLLNSCIDLPMLKSLHFGDYAFADSAVVSFESVISPHGMMD